MLLVWKYTKILINSSEEIAAIADNGNNFVKALRVEKFIFEILVDLDTEYISCNRLW